MVIHHVYVNDHHHDRSSPLEGNLMKEYKGLQIDTSHSWVVRIEEEEGEFSYYPIVGWIQGINDEGKEVTLISPVFFSGSRDWEIADEYEQWLDWDGERQVMHVTEQEWEAVYDAVNGFDTDEAELSAWLKRRKRVHIRASKTK